MCAERSWQQAVGQAGRLAGRPCGQAGRCDGCAVGQVDIQVGRQASFEPAEGRLQKLVLTNKKGR